MFYGPETKELLRQAAELLPGWSWSHHARAQLLWYEKKWEEMVRELEPLVAKQPAFQEGWRSLADGLEKLERWAAAERAYGKLAKLRRQPFSVGVWRVQLKAAGESEQARTRLRRELARWQKTELAPQYQMGLARAYRELLADTATAKAIEEGVKRSHPDWNRELYGFESSMSWTYGGGGLDGPERVLCSGRQFWLKNQYHDIVGEEKDVSQKIARIRTLLQEGQQPGLRREMQRELLRIQIEAKDWPGAKATLADFLASNPENIEQRLQLAQALAENKVGLDDALRLVDEAKAMRREFRPWVWPKQFTLGEWGMNYSGLERQREAHNKTLAAIAAAGGWILAQQDKLEEAERELRTALGLNPMPEAQYHLGLVLDRQGKFEEALELLVKVAVQKSPQQEAARQAAEAVFQKRQAAGVEALIARARAARLEEERVRLRGEFIHEPAKDFELLALDGQSYRLSALRGKVVLLNFWSTGCGPCVEEMPELVRLYEKYRAAGLEILAISTDDDKAKLAAFVAERKLPFPVLLADKVDVLYGVEGFPDNLFIDREGNIRYRQRGFGPGSEIAFAAVVEELLGNAPAQIPPPPDD